MKTIIRSVCVLLVIAACGGCSAVTPQPPANSPVTGKGYDPASGKAFSSTAAEFAMADLRIDELAFGASQAEARAKYGEPTSASSVTWDATGDTFYKWHYAKKTLTFLEGKLNGIDVTDEAVVGPRGIKVGDSLETVLKAFKCNEITGPGVLYYAQESKNLDFYLPPSGELIWDEDENLYVLDYLCPETPYDQEVLDDLESYVFRSHASLWIEIDKATLKVTSFAWTVQAMAE